MQVTFQGLCFSNEYNYEIAQVNLDDLVDKTRIHYSNKLYIVLLLLLDCVSPHEAQNACPYEGDPVIKGQTKPHWARVHHNVCRYPQGPNGKIVRPHVGVVLWHGLLRNLGRVCVGQVALKSLPSRTNEHRIMKRAENESFCLICCYRVITYTFAWWSWIVTILHTIITVRMFQKVVDEPQQICQYEWSEWRMRFVYRTLCKHTWIDSLNT